MQFRNSFEVQADADHVYAFLLDVTQVVTCVPGASLTEVVDADTYRGRAKIKLGAIVMAYDGKATITDRDPAERSAILRAEGRETSGGGAAAMQAQLRVSPAPHGSAVSIVTDLAITGRAAQFGRGIIEDVSKRLVGQMASAIKARLEESDPAAAAAPPASSPARAEPPVPPQDAPVNLLAVLLSVLRERLTRLLRRRARPSPGVEPTEP